MEQDIVGAGDQWLSDDKYEFIQTHMPIVCVDVLLSPAGDPRQVALIRRAAPEGDAWCLVGGRVLRNERLADAVDRHVAKTLGTGVHVDRSTLEFGAVIEYPTKPGPDGLYDPRKHAVSVTYAASCDWTREPEAIGEAFEVAWFRIDQLSEVSFGFGQGEAVARVLKKLERI